MVGHRVKIMLKFCYLFTYPAFYKEVYIVPITFAGKTLD